MLNQFICGIGQCNSIQKKGNHGLIRSIEKYMPINFENTNSNILKQKKSLKYIINKQSRQTNNMNIKNHQPTRNCNQYQQTNGMKQQNMFKRTQNLIIKGNNSINSYVQQQKNRRNFQYQNSSYIKNAAYHVVGSHHQIQSYQNANQFGQQDKQQIMQSNGYQMNHMIQNRMKHQKAHINQVKHPKKLQLISLDNNTKNQNYVFKQNIINHSNVNTVRNNNLNIQKQSKTLLKAQIPEYHPYDMLPTVRSHKLINYDKTQQSRLQNDQQIKFKTQLTNDKLSSIPFNIKQTVNLTQNNLTNFMNSPRNNLQLKDLTVNQQQKSQKYKRQKMNTEPQCSFNNFQSYSYYFQEPNKNINSQIKFIKQPVHQNIIKKQLIYIPINTPKNREQIIDKQKLSNEYIITRQNSKISIALKNQNPKLSMLTSKTNDSHSSKYQKQKQFQNRFNANNVNQIKYQNKLSNSNQFTLANSNHLNNSTNFGVQSSFQYLNNQNLNNQSKAINFQNSTQNSKIFNLNQDLQQKIQKNSIYNQDFYNNNKYDQKNQIKINNLQNKVKKSQLQQNLNKITFDQTQNTQILKPQVNKKGKQTKHKRKRYSFFQTIQMQKPNNQPKPTIFKQLKAPLQPSNKIQSTKNLSLGNKENIQSQEGDSIVQRYNTQQKEHYFEQLKQLSVFEMKHAQSVVQSQNSQSDSQIQFVYSTNNVKLKSFAMLKSLHAIKNDHIKDQS